MKLALLLLSLVSLQKDPAVADAWAEVKGGTVAIYATVNNPTMYDAYLVSATSERAGKVEFVDGEKPAASVTVPAYGAAELKPGALFIKLSELKGDLKAGDTVAVTLVTDGGIAIPLAAVVK